MAANETNIENLQTLLDRGYSRREIAQTLQRDPRVVSQILRGEKAYDNLEGSISELATQQSAPVSGPPRRERESGGRARTRGEDAPPAVRGRYKSTPTGFIRSVSGGRAILNTLQRAASSGKAVKITLRVAYVSGYKGGTRTNADVTIFGHGQDAGRLRDALSEVGESRVGQTLMDIAQDALDLDEIRGFQYATVQAADWSAFWQQDERSS